MAKVTLRETPSEQLIKQAASEVTVTDAKGRVITLKKPNALSSLRLVSAIGSEDAENRMYLAMVSNLVYVSAIDGDAVFIPSSKRELEALYQRLDEHGLLAIQQGVAEHFQRDDEDEVATAKK